MIELGKIQELEILRITSVGAYLNEENGNAEDDILLPTNQIPEGAEEGDILEVFVYRDSEDRMIATRKRPKLTIGRIGFLKVVDTTKIGAFLDWGLEKDLLLPFKEQTNSVIKGKTYMVSMYVDKSDRLCATMYINKTLSEKSPYKVNDKVRGIIYNMQREIGVFVAVDDKYQALIPAREVYQEFRVGDIVEARVAKIKDDGKLDLSLRKKASEQMTDDTDIVMEALKMNNGVLDLNDSSSPEDIKRRLSMSKKAFKRAVGRLLKEKKIVITTNGIKKK